MSINAMMDIMTIMIKQSRRNDMPELFGIKDEDVKIRKKTINGETYLYIKDKIKVK